MKSIALTALACALLGGCVESLDDAAIVEDGLSTDTSEVTTAPVVYRSTDWTTRTSAEDIWPSRVESIQVFLRRGEDSRATPTAGVFQVNYLAFVVWNGNTMGKIFRVRFGADSEDFNKKLQGIALARTTFNFNGSWSMAGSLTGGRRPPSPPTPGGHLEFSASFVRRTVDLGNSAKNFSTQFVSMEY